MYRKLALASIILVTATGCVGQGIFSSSNGDTTDRINDSAHLKNQVDEVTPQWDYEPIPAYGEPAINPIPTPGNADYVVSAGQCWVQTQVQPRATQYDASIIVEEARNKIQVTPADMRRGYRQVVTAEGVKTFRIEPPTYKIVTEQVMVKPELTRFDVIPAVYENRQVDIVVTPPKTVLEPCRAAGVTFSQSAATQSFCAREIPAVTERITQRVVVQEEQTNVRFESAIYETVTKRVVDRPARAVEMLTQEVVDNIPVQELVAQEQTEVIEIPAITKQMQLTEFDGPPRIVARQALCNTDLTDSIVSNIQRTLSERGFNPGPQDGKLGKMTISALEQFQTENGLGVGALTLESLDALGISY